LTHRAKTERFIGRLPRHIAYPLILVVSIVSWSCVGIAAAWVARLFSS
jgi:hypothetical protein